MVADAPDHTSQSLFELGFLEQMRTEELIPMIDAATLMLSEYENLKVVDVGDVHKIAFNRLRDLGGIFADDHVLFENPMPRLRRRGPTPLPDPGLLALQPPPLE